MANGKWQMSLEPREQRRLVERQRLRVVEMPARTLGGCAAGMEGLCPLRSRQAGKLPLLKSRSRDSGNACPVGKRAGPSAPGFAKPAIRGVVLKLEREKLERELAEGERVCRCDTRRFRGSDKPAQMRRKAG